MFSSYFSEFKNIRIITAVEMTNFHNKPLNIHGPLHVKHAML